jgi:hypothetical protein
VLPLSARALPLRLLLSIQKAEKLKFSEMIRFWGSLARTFLQIDSMQLRGIPNHFAANPFHLINDAFISKHQVEFK